MKDFPSAFVERIQSMLPESEWEDFFRLCTEPLPKVVRVTPLSPPLKEGKNTWDLKPTTIEGAYFVDRVDRDEVPLGKTLEHFTGEVYVQSLSSMLPVVVLDPQPGEKILDMCAAPGSKSTFIASQMENIGSLICNEMSSSRCKKLVANLNRLSVCNTVVTQNDGVRMSNFFDQEFDRILLDAPCSSEGFGRKDSKFFQSMWSEKKIYDAAKLQRQLICSAFEMLRPGGVLVYSTCTSAPEENELVVQYLLDTYGDAVEFENVENLEIPFRSGVSEWDNKKVDQRIVENSWRIWPHLQTEKWNSESFYLIRIRKTRALKDRQVAKISAQNSISLKGRELEILKKNHRAEVLVRLEKQFGMSRSLFDDYELVSKDGEIWLMTRDCYAFVRKNLYQRAGLQVMDRDGNFSSEFVIGFGRYATGGFVGLDDQMRDRWLAGYDLSLEERIEKTEGKKQKTDKLLVKYGRFCLGWGKVMHDGTKLKNKLSRDLVF